MPNFSESKIEYADFTFDRQKVVCYGLINTAGGKTTVLNFNSPDLAEEFQARYLTGDDIAAIRNGAQLICLVDYDNVMCSCENDPRVRCLTYSRDYMMGTLAYAS